jgi:hypothetical protein
MPILHWLNDEGARKTSSRVPYRLLEADAALSYGNPNTENMLIQGDNLEALKALFIQIQPQELPRQCLLSRPLSIQQTLLRQYHWRIRHCRRI